MRSLVISQPARDRSRRHPERSDGVPHVRWRQEDFFEYLRDGVRGSRDHQRHLMARAVAWSTFPLFECSVTMTPVPPSAVASLCNLATVDP